MVRPRLIVARKKPVFLYWCSAEGGEKNPGVFLRIGTAVYFCTVVCRVDTVYFCTVIYFLGWIAVP